MRNYGELCNFLKFDVNLANEIFMAILKTFEKLAVGLCHRKYGDKMLKVDLEEQIKFGDKMFEFNSSVLTNIKARHMKISIARRELKSCKQLHQSYFDKFAEMFAF